MANFLKTVLAPVLDVGAAIQHTFAPNKMPQAEGQILSDGSVSHNVDLTGFKGDDLDEAEALIACQIEKIEELEEKKQAAYDSGDAVLAGHYHDKLEAAQKNFDEMKWQLEHGDLDLTAISAFFQLGPVGFILVGHLRGPDTADRIEDAAEVEGYSAAELEAVSAGATPAPSPKATDGTDGTAASGDIWDQSPEDWVREFSNDPQAFFGKLKDMDPADRNAVLSLLQQELQEQNQLFSMITNFQSALHDTQKAMISNLRV